EHYVDSPHETGPFGSLTSVSAIPRPKTPSARLDRSSQPPSFARTDNAKSLALAALSNADSQQPQRAKAGSAMRRSPLPSPGGSPRETPHARLTAVPATPRPQTPSPRLARSTRPPSTPRPNTASALVRAVFSQSDSQQPQAGNPSEDSPLPSPSGSQQELTINASANLCRFHTPVRGAPPSVLSFPRLSGEQPGSSAAPGPRHESIAPQVETPSSVRRDEADGSLSPPASRSARVCSAPQSPPPISPRTGIAVASAEATALGLRDGVDVAHFMLDSGRLTALSNLAGSRGPYVLMEKKGSPYELVPAKRVLLENEAQVVITPRGVLRLVADANGDESLELDVDLPGFLQDAQANEIFPGVSGYVRRGETRDFKSKDGVGVVLLNWRRFRCHAAHARRTDRFASIPKLLDPPLDTPLREVFAICDVIRSIKLFHTARARPQSVERFKLDQEKHQMTSKALLRCLSLELLHILLTACDDLSLSLSSSRARMEAAQWLPACPDRLTCHVSYKPSELGMHHPPVSPELGAVGGGARSQGLASAVAAERAASAQVKFEVHLNLPIT
ncbi:MAG: hypothetical protein SGPRY_011514, partial [Prymnesium sp.]